MELVIVLFLAGVLTILLPCILPLVPVVLGASIAGRSKLLPLLTIAGLLLSFVGGTWLLTAVLREFVNLADYVRLSSFYVLLLLGLGFVTEKRFVRTGGAAAGALFFSNKGLPAVLVAAALGIGVLYAAAGAVGRFNCWGSGCRRLRKRSSGRRRR